MMTRLLLLFLAIFSSLDGHSQLDTLHYLPPLYGRASLGNHYVSISTLSTNNVSVIVLKGDGSLIQNVTISSANPALILLGTGITAQGLINEAGLNSVNTDDGIIVRSSEPTIVNLRHVQSAQGLCLTSKGRFALGKEFRSGHLFSNGNKGLVKSHLISVMATQDNTVVNFSDFSSNVIFKNTSTTAGTSTPITVMLNKGESYLIAAYLDEPGATGNVNDVNGTKISASKPIAVNSGSWLGGSFDDGKDIGVDQITPERVIGTEYVFTEGDGPAITERPCVVAQYDNTQIFINGGSSPVATINAGDHYFILNSAYSANGNIYVRTSNPSFLFQSMCGSTFNGNGLNFIPPIRCAGSTTVSIPNVNLVGIPTVSITARTGASVYVNGSTTPIGGAKVVTGNSSWVTYDVAGGTGNFTVSSDSVINVALLTLNGARGSAGYFSGFGELHEVKRGDSTDFFLCQNSSRSFLKLNIKGPYSSITPSFTDPSLGGGFTVNSVSEDTVYYTYTNASTFGLIDTLKLEVCKILDCSGTQIDTFCSESILIFEKYAPINAGIGDSIVICADADSVDLFSVLSGNPLNTGIWVDVDQSGILFNGVFRTDLSIPGVYHYTYLVNGSLDCYDSSVVIVNVLPSNSAYCCPINPSFSVQNINCNGGSTGFIQILDAYATQFSIDSGLTFQASGTFSALSAGSYSIRLELGSNCYFDTIINLSEPNLLTGNFQSDTILCFGDCNGSIISVPNGGSTPYHYQINGMPTQTTPQFIGLCSGNYTVSVIDANSCTYNQNVQVVNRQILSLSIDSIIDETCSFTNGQISVIAQGGSPVYAYSINNGLFQASPTFTGLASGNYILNVKDAYNCTKQLPVSISNQLGPIPFVDTLTNIACFSGLNGTVIIGDSIGTSGLLYALDNGASQNSNTFNTIVAGNHSVIVTDVNGCTDSVSFSIIEPSQLSLITSHQNVICFDDCSGQVFLDVSGSTPPYNYSINGGLFNPMSFAQFDTIVNVCANNNINISIQDSLGCIINSLVSVLEPDSIEISTSLTDPSCFYNCDGTMLLQTNGGTGAFEYSIDNGLTYQGNNQFLNLCDSSYDLKVKDSNLCVSSSMAFLNIPLEFKVDTVAIVHTTCGNSDGTIAVGIDGPIHSNYTFTNINTGAVIANVSTAVFTSLAAGAYGIMASDDLGCLDTMYVGVNDSSLTIHLATTSITEVNCYGACTGNFTVSANGGNAPYQYSINNGSLVNSSTFIGLCAEEYLVLVEDVSGCIETVQVEITEPDMLSFSTNTVDVDCFGNCTGKATATNSIGGTLPYSFSIDNGVSYFTDSSFVNLCAGQNTIILNDANNCQVSENFQIAENSELTAIETNYDLTCYNSADGIILLQASGGIPSYQYSIDGGLTFTSSPNHTSLNAGQYFIEIKDDLNCAFYDTVNVSKPTQNNMTISKTENLCSNTCEGELILNTTGGTSPYLYSINNGVSFQTSHTFTDLCSGEYQIKVVDDNNCHINMVDSLMFIDTLKLSTVIADSDCDAPTGAIEVMATGGHPNYNYSIDNILYNTNSVFNGLSAGTYDVYVRDDNNCLIIEQQIVNHFLSPQIDSIESVLPCHGECNGELLIYASGGDGNYEFSIGEGIFQSHNQFISVCGGSYAVTVKDGAGCSNSINYALQEPDTISFSAIVNPILCAEQTGSINITAQGGIGQLVYVFNGGLASSLNSYSQLSAGSYALEISDEIGCSVQFDTALTEPDPIQIAFNAINPTCFNLCDGSIEAIISGGTLNGSNYNYNWSQFNSNSALQNNVCSGLYSLVVQDDNGCLADSINFELTEPLFPEFDSLLVNGPSCYGSSAGSSVKAYASSGSLFSFNDGATFSTNNQINDIAEGAYWIHVQDANNCKGDSIQAIIVSPQPLSGFLGPDANICSGDMVDFTVFAVGGNAPYQYNWNNGNNFQLSFSENVYTDSSYSTEIIDANNCVYTTANQQITIASPPVITTSNDTIVCSNSSVYLWAAHNHQVEDYVFNWSIGAANTEHFIIPTIESDTVFYIDITDQCNLTSSDSIHVSIFVKPEIKFQIDSVNGCIPHTQEYIATISENGIMGNIDWGNSIGEIRSSNNNGLTIAYNFSGNDNLTANYTSLDGCEFQSDFDTYISINSSPIADFTYSPDRPDNYDNLISFKNESFEHTSSLWSFSGQRYDTENVDLPIESINNIYKPLLACLEVSNNENCSDQICKSVNIEADQLVLVPNAFTPGDYNNSVFKAVGTNVDIYEFHMTIFNRWGEIVFESFDIDYGWDGTYNGKQLSTNTFTWKIRVSTESSPSQRNNLVGHVTLLR